MSRSILAILLILNIASCHSRDANGQSGLPSVQSVTSAEIVELLRQHKGKVVLVNVWATWCAPCREEMPSLVKLHKEFRDTGLELVLISVDDAEIVQTKVRPMLKEFGVDFSSYINTSSDEDFINALNKKWTGALPTTFVYDREGNLGSVLVGMQSYENFVDVVRRALRS